MAYSPPVGSVTLNLRAAYAPPTGTVPLNLLEAADSLTATVAATTQATAHAAIRARVRATGAATTQATAHSTVKARFRAVVTAVTAGATAAILVNNRIQATVAARTQATAHAIVRSRFRAALAATTAPSTAQAAVRSRHRLTVHATTQALAAGAVHYDPNLLSAVNGLTATTWQETTPLRWALNERWQQATLRRGEGLAGWGDAPARLGGDRNDWREALRREAAIRPRWADAFHVDAGTATPWRQALFLSQAKTTTWREGALTLSARVSGFRVRLPLRVGSPVVGWDEALSEALGLLQGHTDGTLLLGFDIERWQAGGTPGNAPRFGPPQPPAPPGYVWDGLLNLECAAPAGGSLRLNLDFTPCIGVARRRVPIRRTYMSANSASLLRWPDLTPLPVTRMSIETDADSWCWALSAELAGSNAYALVEPHPLPREVVATINGVAWHFLLDTPNRSRQFNQERIALKGRSRSAWLASPYAESSSGANGSARERQQLAEEALENTGWTLVWNLANWLIPAGRTAWNGSPMDRLLALVNATGDGLYTDPTLNVLTAMKRWPVASWLLDGETADLAVPESAVLSLSQTPTTSAPLNGVYVAGTTHGVLALVKIAGTDGARQPAEPLVQELLCDPAGVAARARGLNALSDAGDGMTLDAELLLTAEVGLVRPGLIVDIAGLKGVSRSVKIDATWANGLSVRQSVGLERREVEA